MALLSNSLHSIEDGSKLWRHFINYDFNLVYSITTLDALLATYSDSVHTHSEYKLRSVAETDIHTAMDVTFTYDISFTSKTTGLVFKDRTTATYKRLYVDNGVLLIEAV